MQQASVGRYSGILSHFQSPVDVCLADDLVFAGDGDDPAIVRRMNVPAGDIDHRGFDLVSG